MCEAESINTCIAGTGKELGGPRSDQELTSAEQPKDTEFWNR